MMRRSTVVDKIKNLLPESEDDILLETYTTVCVLKKEKDEKINRPQKIQYISKNLVDLDRSDLTKIYEKLYDSENKLIQKENMYNILLNILNDIINTFNDGTKNIDVVTDFKNVDGNRLMTIEVITLIKAKYDLIFSSGYDKKKCGFYEDKRVQTGHISVLKGMCKECDYSFESKRKYKVVDDEKCINVSYSIVKKKI